MPETEKEWIKYTCPTYFIDSSHLAVREAAINIAGDVSSRREKALKLFYYVRDTYDYSPYHVSFEKETLRASHILMREGRKKGYCIEKTILYAALLRVFGIPVRMVFCNVRNHIGTGKLEELIGTDLLVFHGYNEVWLDGQWVKCTVAFNRQLCERLNVEPLEFDGIHDSIFQEYDRKGGRFMKYEYIYGAFHDMPHDLWLSETKRLYPKLFTEEVAAQYEKMGKAKLFQN